MSKIQKRINELIAMIDEARCVLDDTVSWEKAQKITRDISAMRNELKILRSKQRK